MNITEVINKQQLELSEKKPWHIWAMFLLLVIAYVNEVQAVEVKPVEDLTAKCTIHLSNCLEAGSVTTVVGPGQLVNIKGDLCIKESKESLAGRHIVIMVDISESMQTADKPALESLPKRAEAALDLINELINQGYEKDHIGVILFADQSFNKKHKAELIYPLTPLPEVFSAANFIRRYSAHEAGGTDLEWPLLEAKKMLTDKENPVLIIFSDGAPYVQDYTFGGDGQKEYVRKFCQNSHTLEEKVVEFGEGLDFDTEKSLKGCDSLNEGDNNGHWTELEAIETKLAHELAVDNVKRLIDEDWFKNLDVFTIYLKNHETAQKELFEKHYIKDLKDGQNGTLLKDLAMAGKVKAEGFYSITEVSKLIESLTEIGRKIRSTHIKQKTLVTATESRLDNNSNSHFLFQNIQLQEGQNPLSLQVKTLDDNNSDLSFQIVYWPVEDKAEFSDLLTCDNGNHPLSPKKEGTVHSEDLTANDETLLQGGSAGCGSIDTSSQGGTGLTLLTLVLPLFLLMVFRKVHLGFVLLLVTVSFYGMEGQASNFGMNIQTFSPVTDGKGTSGVSSSKTLGFGELHTSFYQQYTNNPVQLSFANGDKKDKVTDHLYTTYYQLAYGLHPQFDMGLSLPLHFYQDLTLQQDNLITDLESYFGMGDLVIDAKYHFFTSHAMRLDLTFLPYITIPTGEAERLLGDESYGVGLLLLMDHRINSEFRLLANLGGKFRSNAVYLEDERATYTLEVRNQTEYALAVVYNNNYLKELQLSSHLKGLAANLSGLIGNDATSPLELGFDAKYQALKNLMFTLGTGFGLGQGIGTPDYRVHLGVNYSFSILGSNNQDDVWTLLSDN